MLIILHRWNLDLASKMQISLRRIIDGLSAVTALGAAIAVILIMLHIVADVVARFIFGRPLPGTINFVSNFYMVAVVFLPLALSEKRKAHISVEVIWSLFPPRLQRRLEVVVLLLTAGVFALLAVSSAKQAWIKFVAGSVLLQDDVIIPVWIAYFLLPIGSAVMVLATIKNLAALFKAERDDSDAPLNH